MGKKTSTYARKRQATGGQYDGGAWVSTIQRCRPYDDQVLPGNIAPTLPAATKSMLRVHEAFESIKTRQTPADNTLHFDLLTHAMAVATIRAIQIAGADIHTNAMLQILVPANAALRRVLERRRTTGVWGFDGPALAEVAAAVEVYDTILQSSTPAEMLAARDLLLVRKLGGFTETLEPLDTMEKKQ